MDNKIEVLKRYVFYVEQRLFCWGSKGLDKFDSDL